MEIKDYVIMTTAIIGCVTGISGLVLNLATRFSKPKYKVYPNQLIVRFQDEVTINGKQTKEFKFGRIEPSSRKGDSIEQTILLPKDSKEWKDVELLFSVVIINCSNTVQFVLGAKYEYHYLNKSLVYSIETDSSLEETIQTLQPQQAVPIRFRFMVPYSLISDILRIDDDDVSIPISSDIGKISIFTSTKVICQNINTLFTEFRPKTSWTLCSIEYRKGKLPKISLFK